MLLYTSAVQQSASAGLFWWMHFKRGQAIFMDTFIFHPNQTALVREQHLCFRLHECLDGIVITDHRLMLQRKLFPRSDSSYHRGPHVQSLRRIMDCVVLTHAHTDTYAHTQSYDSPFHFVPSPITPFHVNNDTRTPPLSCQNLLPCVFVNLKTEERERLRFKKSRKQEAVLCLCCLASSHLVRWQWGEEKEINDRSDHLSFVLFSLPHFRTLLVWGQMDFPHSPKMNIQTFIKPICIKGTGKNHIRYIQGYYIHIYALRVLTHTVAF